MTRRLSLLLVAAAVASTVPAAAGAATLNAVSDDPSGAARAVGRVASIDGNLLVTFRDRPGAAAAAVRLAGLGRVRTSVPEVGVWELVPADRATVRRRVLTRAGVLRAEWSLERRLTDLPPRRPAIASVAPQIAIAEPGDPHYLDTVRGQWERHLGNWSPALTGNTDRPIIAILDSGIDYDHPEWRTPGLIVSPFSTVRQIPDARDWSASGHGTHVAGIAAAPANGIGIVGVAPANVDPATPGARIMPVQIANSRGISSDTTQMQGIRWAVIHGAKVINISSGGEGYSQAYQDTVNWAYKRGALIVASVGNEGQADNVVNFPAGYDHVVGVGAQCGVATSAPDCPAAFGRATFSNYNYTVDVLAPGVKILSTVPGRITRDLLAPGYGYIDGTSMAAPFVAGTAALVFASHPGITPFQVTRILESTSSRGAVGLPRNSKLGWGNVNPAAAVAASAPVNDTAEPNDDVKLVPRAYTVSLARERVRTLTAWADYNDDQYDTYALDLARGKRVRVTLTAEKGRLGAIAFRPGGNVSPRVVGEALLDRRVLGATQRVTPGRRGFVFTAPVTGRHFIWVVALTGGGEYSVKLERLN